MRFRETAVIDAPASAIFDCLTGRGSPMLGEAAEPGDVPVPVEVREDRLIHWHTTGKKTKRRQDPDIDVRVELEPVRGGTRVTATFEFDLRWFQELAPTPEWERSTIAWLRRELRRFAIASPFVVAFGTAVPWGINTVAGGSMTGTMPFVGAVVLAPIVWPGLAGDAWPVRRKFAWLGVAVLLSALALGALVVLGLTRP